MNKKPVLVLVEKRDGRLIYSGKSTHKVESKIKEMPEIKYVAVVKPYDIYKASVKTSREPWKLKEGLTTTICCDGLASITFMIPPIMFVTRSKKRKNAIKGAKNK